MECKTDSDPPFFHGRRVFGLMALTALGGFAGGAVVAGADSLEEWKSGWEAFARSIRGFALCGTLLGGFLAPPICMVLWAFLPATWTPRSRWGWMVSSFVVGALVAAVPLLWISSRIVR